MNDIEKLSSGYRPGTGVPEGLVSGSGPFGDCTGNVPDTTISLQLFINKIVQYVYQQSFNKSLPSNNVAHVKSYRLLADRIVKMV